MSAITDKWLKAVPLYTDTLAGAISNATVTTFQVTNGSTDLENGEVYEVTIDRVTAQGVSTGRREVVIAQYTSATKTFDCSSADYRGIEGAAQAHPVGAVVEILVTAHYLNEHRAAFLVGHTQAGAHASALPLTSPVLTTPKVVTSINDANGNEVIKTPATTSAVNEVTITNSATGNAVQVAATGGDTDVSLNLVSKGAGTVQMNGTPIVSSIITTAKYAPQGFLLNGKIVPSVASNNLTVAIKGMDGNDPSASNPVYVRIGDTVRTITAALSVTKNAGTNWFDSGSTKHATKEIDYFVYLGYNATDGVVIGFARIPYVKEYGEFSTTTTSEKYCAISTITNATTGDDYEVVGRFAATLSATASFNWSVPTFSNINLIQRPIFETRWLVYSPSIYTSGSMTSASVTHYSKYKLRDSTCECVINEDMTLGGTASTVVAVKLPIDSTHEGYTLGGGALYTNSLTLVGAVFWVDSGTTDLYFKRYDSGNFTLGVSQAVHTSLVYKII